MSLQKSIDSYIDSWNGHTELEGLNLINLEDKLKTSTIEELNEAYNILTLDDLWNEPLYDVFYNEFHKRLFEQTTFSISIENIMIGFDDVYPNISGPVIDGRNLNDVLSKDNFSEDTYENIVRILIHLNVDVINRDGQIIGLEGVNEKVYFDKNHNGIKTKPMIQQSDDWKLYRDIYMSLRNQTPIIIN